MNSNPYILAQADAVLYPDSGFRRDEHALALWRAHMYDTGGEPFYSADKVSELLAAQAEDLRRQSP